MITSPRCGAIAGIILAPSPPIWTRPIATVPYGGRIAPSIATAFSDREETDYRNLRRLAWPNSFVGAAGCMAVAACSKLPRLVPRSPGQFRDDVADRQRQGSVGWHDCQLPWRLNSRQIISTRVGRATHDYELGYATDCTHGADRGGRRARRMD